MRIDPSFNLINSLSSSSLSIRFSSDIIPVIAVEEALEFPSDILTAAAEGDLQAKEVGNQLAGFAGQAFGDFALMNMALGGVYLIGGVARAMMPHLQKATFKKNFYERGNFSEIMKKISVHLILDDYAALKGCANYSTILSGE